MTPKPKELKLGEFSAGGIQRQLSQEGGKFQRYVRWTVGSQSLGHLVIYEFVLLLSNIFRHSLGNQIRQFLYPLIFAEIGRDCRFGDNMIIYCPKQIKIGNHVTIGENVFFSVKGSKASIVIDDHVSIGAGTIVNTIGGVLRIGSGTTIGKNCRLGSSLGFTIGENSYISDECCVVSAGHAYDRKDLPIIAQPLTCRGANSVGDKVTIGKGATIRDGVHIGSGSIISKHALVLSDVAPDSVMHGVPAKPKEKIA